MLRTLMCLVLLLGALVAAGCGGDDAPEPPTAVAAADLDENGEFWITLTPDLKDELIDMGKQRLGEERPDGASGIQAMDTRGLVAEVDKQYANKSKRTDSIYETYTGANDKFAKANLDDALNGLDQLEGEQP